MRGGKRKGKGGEGRGWDGNGTPFTHV